MQLELMLLCRKEVLLMILLLTTGIPPPLPLKTLKYINSISVDFFLKTKVKVDTTNLH